MSIYSRDYMRDEPGSGGFGGPRTWSLLTWLIAANVVIFLVDQFARGALQDYLGLSLPALLSGKLWTPLTYQFVHGGVLHLLFNMLMLFFLGRVLLQLVGPQHLLKIYLLGGILGGILQLGFSFLMKENASVIGASGAAMAVVFAVATLIPHQSFQLLLFFVIPVRMTMRQMAMLFVAIDAFLLLLILSGSQNPTAVVAHLGGMLFGWLYIKYWYTRKSPSRPSKPKKKRGFGVRILRDGEPGPKESTEKEPYLNDRVDALLDKINEHGFQSLTDEEKKILERSSEKLSRRNKRT